MYSQRSTKGGAVAINLVSARIRLDKLDELEERLRSGRFDEYPGFTPELVYGLKHALMLTDVIAVWEENVPVDRHLKEERDTAVNAFFSLHAMREIGSDSGWELLREFPRLFPEFADVQIQ